MSLPKRWRKTKLTFNVEKINSLPNHLIITANPQRFCFTRRMWTLRRVGFSSYWSFDVCRHLKRAISRFHSQFEISIDFLTRLDNANISDINQIKSTFKYYMLLVVWINKYLFEAHTDNEFCIDILISKILFIFLLITCCIYLDWNRTKRSENILGIMWNFQTILLRLCLL